jgi:two-component system sensor histidine kinase RegB
MSTRPPTAERGGGLGLGLFIAKTLIERSGARIGFRNSAGLGEGAMVEIDWPRAAFVNPDSAGASAIDVA